MLFARADWLEDNKPVGDPNKRFRMPDPNNPTDIDYNYMLDSENGDGQFVYMTETGYYETHDVCRIRSWNHPSRSALF